MAQVQKQLLTRLNNTKELQNLEPNKILSQIKDEQARILIQCSSTPCIDIWADLTQLPTLYFSPNLTHIQPGRSMTTNLSKIFTPILHNNHLVKIPEFQAKMTIGMRLGHGTCMAPDVDVHPQLSTSLHDKRLVKQKLLLITHQVLTQPKRAELGILLSTKPMMPKAWPTSYFCQYLTCAEPATHQFQSDRSESD